MTEKEALRELKRRYPPKVFGTELYCEAYDIAFKALEKQIAKEPIFDGWTDEFNCPSCNGFVGDSPGDCVHCSWCGQKIDWSDKDGQIQMA